MSENAAGMDQKNFSVDNNNLHEKYWLVNEKSHYLMLETLDKLSELNLPVLLIKKTELNDFAGDNDKTLNYRGNDEIEIKLSKGEKVDKTDKEKYLKYLCNKKHEDHVEVMIRNKTIANEPLKPKLEGELVEIDKNELARFIQFWDENDVAVPFPPSSHRLKEYLRYYDDFKNNNGRIFLFKEKNGNSFGAVFLKEGSRKNETTASVDWLQVLTREENRGIARSILSELKKRYDEINLWASSRHPTLNYDEAQSRLLRLYKSSGLTGGLSWNKKVINLDDSEKSREWQKVGEQVGFDNIKVDRVNLLQFIISKYIDLGDDASIPFDIREKMKSWRLAEKEKKELSKQINDSQ